VAVPVLKKITARWLYVARESGSTEIANRLIDSITPSPWGNTLSSTAPKVRTRSLFTSCAAAAIYKTGRNSGTQRLEKLAAKLKRIPRAEP
jgi:hypothetical protein